MRIILYVESVELLRDFLEKRSENNVTWSIVPYLNFIQVSLECEEYETLIKVSEPKIDEETQGEIKNDEDVNFWNMPEEDLKEFNKRGLFSLEQLKNSFVAGTDYVLNLKLEIDEEIHKKPKMFEEWYEDNIKQ